MSKPNVGDTVSLNDHGLSQIFGTSSGLAHMTTLRMFLTHVGAESLTEPGETYEVRVSDPSINQYVIDHNCFDVVARREDLFLTYEDFNAVIVAMDDRIEKEQQYFMTAPAENYGMGLGTAKDWAELNVTWLTEIRNKLEAMRAGAPRSRAIQKPEEQSCLR
jgi:hypothetical protein